MAIARDHYQTYFAEKLWQWIPAIYREQDALLGGDALRGFIEAIAEQAALTKRSQDRLWDDTAIELAADWAVPYIGQLLETRLVSSLNLRGRRVDTAKTIYYRRRKGTPLVQQQLVSDIAGWDSLLVEEYRRLARAWHMLDCPNSSGRLTGTPNGGIADFRSPRGSRLVNDPFNEFHHLPESRNPTGISGRRQIETLSYHIFRLAAVPLSGVQPRHMGTLADGRELFTSDPSGRDIHLFSGNTTAQDWSDWQAPKEWELPRPITCRLLAEEIFSITAEEIAWILTDAPIALPADRDAAAEDLTRLIGQPFHHRDDFVRVLDGLPNSTIVTSPGVLAGLLSRALVMECGSAALLPNGAGNAPWSTQFDPSDAAYGNPAIKVGFLSATDPVGRPRTRAANLDHWNPPSLSQVDMFISPETGRFVLDTGTHSVRSVSVDYQVGMMSPIGAGALNRETDNLLADVIWSNGSVAAGTPADGLAEVQDSRSYSSPQNQLAVVNTRVRAQEGERPYFALNNHWRLTSAGDDAILQLNGLWLGTRSGRNVILDGNFERVEINFCTLDPGGMAADDSVLPPVDLVIRGYVEQLVIRNSVVGRIRLEGQSASLEYLTIDDSIVQTRLAGVAVINAPTCELRMSRTTVIAPTALQLSVDVERLYASEALIAGQVDVTDNQNGCFRFSAAGAGSRVAKPYRSEFISSSAGLFQSTELGHFQYANLTQRVFPKILVGAENGDEMGAFNQALNRIKQRSAMKKVNEYLPFGRTPNFIIEM